MLWRKIEQVAAFQIRKLSLLSKLKDELAQYSTHGIYDARYTSWVSGQDMVIRHLLLAPNRVYYLIDGEQVVIMGIVHVKRSPQAVTSMIKRFLEEYDK